MRFTSAGSSAFWPASTAVPSAAASRTASACSTSRWRSSAAATARASSGVGFALAQIDADRLAGGALVAERAHHVVAHLERVAER